MNPFACGVERKSCQGEVQVVDAETRIRMVADFDRTQCHQALLVGNLQRTVIQAIGRRLKNLQAKVRVCRACGCTDGRACAAGCAWFEEDLCTVCAKLRDAISEFIQESGLCKAALSAISLVMREVSQDRDKQHVYRVTAYRLGIRVCRVCGCTDGRACAAGCAWFEEDLCTVCAMMREVSQDQFLERLGK